MFIYNYNFYYLDKIIYPDPENEQWEYIQPPQEHNRNSSFPDMDLDSGNLFSFLDAGMASNISDPTSIPNIEHLAQLFTSSNFQQNTPQSSNHSHPVQFLQYKLHIILMAIVTYIVFYTGNEKYVCYSVLFPLLLWELTEMFILKTYPKPHPSFLINILLMFVKLPQTYSNLILKTIETFNKVFNDVGYFMFCFCLIHVVLVWCNGSTI